VRLAERAFDKSFNLGHGIQAEVTEEAIRTIVDKGKEEGLIEENQQDMINNIFKFEEISAEEMMTHRVNIVGADISATVNDIIDISNKMGFSRIPVYKDDPDNIVGIVNVKDLLYMIKGSEGSYDKIEKFIRPVMFIPATNSANSVFKEFTRQKVHMAVVVDEYGGMGGIITMEDLLETIVGSIQDEYDNEAEEIVSMGDNVYELAGTTDISELSDIIGVELEENDEYDTVAGLILFNLGYIPASGEHPVVEVGRVSFEVAENDSQRILKVIATVPPSKTEEKGKIAGKNA
jgi:putative hemolysin